MAKSQRCHGAMDVGKQSKMDDCKQNKKHKKRSFSKSHNWGEQLIKANTKSKWTTFSASLPHTCFQSTNFRIHGSLCFCSVIGGTLEGRESKEKSLLLVGFAPRWIDSFGIRNTNRWSFRSTFSLSFTSSSFGTTYDMWFC